MKRLIITAAAVLAVGAAQAGPYMDAAVKPATCDAMVGIAYDNVQMKFLGAPQKIETKTEGQARYYEWATAIVRRLYKSAGMMEDGIDPGVYQILYAKCMDDYAEITGIPDDVPQPAPKAVAHKRKH